MENKKESKVRLIEVFMAKAGRGRQGFDRCFHGTIRRETDAQGNPVVYGKINVNQGYIVSKANDQWLLGDRLDQIVILVLDYDIHSLPAMTTLIFETDFNLN